MHANHVVCMNGGGTESAALLKLLTEGGYQVDSVFLRAGYPAAERHAFAAAALAQHYDVPHRVVTVDYGVDTTHFWADGTPGPQKTWTVMLFSVGTAMAHALGATEVWLGQTFPADRLKAGWDLILDTTQTVVWRPELVFPFSGVGKPDLQLDPDVWDLTDSCYADPACGVCAKCRGRQEAHRA